MEVAFWASQAGFYNRLLKLYLPLLFIGVSGLTWFSLNTSPNAQAASVRPTTKVVYSATYSSSASSAVVSGISTTSCQPDTGFALAGPTTVPSGQNGIIEQFDPVYNHSMYGYTPAQLANLSRRCSLIVPGDSKPYINAYTSYWIGWQFDYAPGDDGLCRVSDVQVPVHIRQALPVWRNLDQAAPALAGEWQAYLSAVKTHEDGHLQLVQQYTNQLLAALQSFPPTDCASIAQSVNSLGNTYISQLKQADAAYELATQNGAAQGAIVP